MDDHLRRALRETLSEAMDREERLVLLLRYVERMTIAEIAATLDLSHARAARMLDQAMQRVRAVTAETA